MKKIFISILAVAALAACTKSDVALDDPAEIGFAPVTGNITKASGLSGNFANTQELGIYAFWDNDGTAGTVSDFTAFNDNYLVNALFAAKSGSWGGSPTGYPWPVNGALVFAGYTTPGDAVLTLDDNNDETTGTEVSYSLANNTMIFSNYENNTEFDLCWFGRTANSYNYRASGTAVPVTLSHALSWISIAVYGEGSAIGWTINSIEWKVPTAGTATCVGTSATWDNLTTPATATNILTTPQTIAAGTTAGGKTTGTKVTDNLVIPSTPVNLTVSYTFKVNGVDKSDSKTVSLKLNDGNTQSWESGVHYTYTLAFNANEILVTPSYGTWSSAEETVTVE